MQQLGQMSTFLICNKAGGGGLKGLPVWEFKMQMSRVRQDESVFERVWSFILFFRTSKDSN